MIFGYIVVFIFCVLPTLLMLGICIMNTWEEWKK